jgi:hypothetical protein
MTDGVRPPLHESAAPARLHRPRAHPLRRAAVRGPAPGQLPRRPGEVRQAAARARDLHLRRRPARHHRLAGAGAAGPADPRDRRRLPGRRARPGQGRHLPAVGGARARRTGLDLQLRRPPRLARPHDPVQGEERQAQGALERRPLHLPGAAGRRHPGLQGDPRAGRRGPEAAPGADPRHRRQVQPRLRRAGLLPPDRAADRGPGRADHVPARRLGQDEQVRSVGPVAHQPDRRRRRHRLEDPQGQDRSRAPAGKRRGPGRAAGGQQPGRHLRRPGRQDQRRSHRRIRRPGLRSLQAGPGRPGGRDPGPGGRADARIPRRSGRDRPRAGGRRRARPGGGGPTLAEVRAKVGFIAL